MQNNKIISKNQIYGLSHLAKPQNVQQLNTNGQIFNIFQLKNTKSSKDKLPTISHHLKETPKLYELVGPLSIKKRILSLDITKNVNNTNIQCHDNMQVKDTKLSNYLNLTNSTINKHSIISKVGKDQQNIYTRQNRTKARYNEYREQWMKQSNKIKDRISSSNTYKSSSKQKMAQTQQSLLERAVKKIYVHSNQQKHQIINNNVTKYWEMSLRNNNKTLKLYMKGTKYQGVQLQQLLQTNEGLRQVQKYIPQLVLTSTDYDKQIVLSGKKAQNKSNIRVNNELTNDKKQEQVFKIKYQGRNTFMSTEGL